MPEALDYQKTLGFAQTYLLFEKSKTKNFIKTAYSCGFRLVNYAMEKTCHLSAGQLCKAKC
ncbi:MAG: hypothetical protein PHY44_00885 [Lachnospiraceae bacterium]|nr:hypothetical protein [Lachnospiraceae bacterium]